MLNAFVIGAQSLLQSLMLVATAPFAPMQAPALETNAPIFAAFVTPTLSARGDRASSEPAKAVASSAPGSATTTSAITTGAPAHPKVTSSTPDVATVAPTAAVLPLTMTVAQAKAPSLDQIVTRLQKTYESTTAFRAKFTQRYTSTLLKSTSESNGTVAFKKPGLMRWDYAAPSTKSFVIDGERLWIHQPEDNLAMVDHCFKQDGLTASVRFLWGAGDIQKDFNVAPFSGVFGTKTDHHLLLTPKTPNGIYLKLILVVDPKSYRVKQSVVVDNQGNVNQFVFEDLDFKPKLKNQDFAMDLPKTTAVSRMPGTCDPARKPAP